MPAEQQSDAGSHIINGTYALKPGESITVTNVGSDPAYVTAAYHGTVVTTHTPAKRPTRRKPRTYSPPDDRHEPDSGASDAHCRCAVCGAEFTSSAEYNAHRFPFAN